MSCITFIYRTRSPLSDEDTPKIEIPDILSIAHKFQALGLSGYDSIYVALAEYVKGKWITYDKEAYKKIARFGLSRLLTS